MGTTLLKEGEEESSARKNTRNRTRGGQRPDSQDHLQS